MRTRCILKCNYGNEEREGWGWRRGCWGKEKGGEKGNRVRKPKGGSLKDNVPVIDKKMGTKNERVTMGN